MIFEVLPVPRPVPFSGEVYQWRKPLAQDAATGAGCSSGFKWPKKRLDFSFHSSLPGAQFLVRRFQIGSQVESGCKQQASGFRRLSVEVRTFVGRIWVVCGLEAVSLPECIRGCLGAEADASWPRHIQRRDSGLSARFESAFAKPRAPET